MRECTGRSVAANTKWDSYWTACEKGFSPTYTKRLAQLFSLIKSIKKTFILKVLQKNIQLKPILTLTIIMVDLLYLPFPGLARTPSCSLECMVNPQITRKAAFNLLVLQPTFIKSASRAIGKTAETQESAGLGMEINICECIYTCMLRGGVGWGAVLLSSIRGHLKRWWWIIGWMNVSQGVPLVYI